MTFVALHIAFVSFGSDVLALHIVFRLVRVNSHVRPPRPPCLPTGFGMYKGVNVISVRIDVARDRSVSEMSD